MASGLFKGISQATTTTRGKFYHPGSFIVRINEIIDRTGEKRTRESGDAVIIAATVIAVRDSGGVPSPLRPNDKVAHMINNKGAKVDLFLGNVKQSISQLASALDVTFGATEHTEEDWERLLDLAMNNDPKKFGGTVQALSNQFIAVNCMNRTSTKTGKDFTIINYGEGYSASSLRQALKALGQPEEITFPNNGLQKLIDAEIAAAAANTAA